MTTMMNRPPPSPDQTPVRSPPFQARALHFLKKLAFRGWKNGRNPKDTVSPVAIPTQNFQRAHSSVDLVRKPDISPFIGFRAEDGPNTMDTDDSSQDASASGNSSPFRPRRHSAWDSLRTAPIRSTFSGRDAAPLFFRDQAGLGDRALVDDSRELEAPAPSISRSTTSLDVDVQPAQSTSPSPEISAQISVAPEAKPHEEAVQDTPINDTPRLSGDVYPHNDGPMIPLTEPTPSTSLDTGTIPRTQSLRTSEDSTSQSIPSRPPLVPRHSAPLPPPFRVTTERGLRLSPSIITRQPMPLLNLPALPPPPLVPDSPPRQRVPLRSMPSLSRHGHSNIECHANHETATLEDSDEDDPDECDEEEFMDASSVHQSDDEDDEPPSAGPSNQAFKISQKRPPRDDDSVNESPISPMSPHSGTVDPDPSDCSCSKTYVQPIRVAPPSSTSMDNYPFSPDILIIEEVSQLHPDLPVPGTSRLENQPTLYRAASRSMINLGSTRRTEWPGKSKEGMGSSATSTSGHTSESHEESEESDTEAIIGRLLRRTSMPSFHPTSDPPPYPTFNPNPRPKETRIVPREDEGRERLPPYSNYLYLIAIMPRKMEFSSPGVQAKDRKWRRVVCELEGTTFRVYKCPPGASGAGVFGDWWEKHVGVGDVAGPNPPRTRKKRSEEEPFERPPKLGIDDPPTPVTPTESSTRSTSVPPVRQRAESQSSMTIQNTSTPRPAKRMSAASFLSPFRSSSTARGESSTGETSHPQPHELELLPVDMHESRSSLSHESTARATPVSRRMSQPPQPRSASRLTFLPVAAGRTQTWRNGEISKPPNSDLLRSYTLQHAESGLGNDYLKRKNVIRVRLEGEQFLLQTPDVPAVVEWIEGIHAGTNIALDIDQRLMPRGPMFPRRRRRRARRAQGEDGSGQRPPVSHAPA